MVKLIIAIDTSHQKKYSGTVSGTGSNLRNLYNEFAKVFQKHGRRGVLHWSKMSRKVREGARKEIIELVNNAKVNFNIFHHPLPLNTVKKDFYLRYIPNIISAVFEPWLRDREALVEIKSDDDFFVAGIKEGTKHFIENFLLRLTDRLYGGYITIRKDDKLRATIKYPNGNLMEFIAYTTRASDSTEVQLIDVILGYFVEDRNGFEKVHFRKI